MCEHNHWQLAYDETSDMIKFRCLDEDATIEDDALIRSKVASLLGRLGGYMRKQQNPDYAAMGRRGMAKRWHNNEIDKSKLE